MASERFEQDIRKKLNQVRVPDADRWEILSARLGQQDISGRFDQMLEAGLSTVSAGNSGELWERIESSLDVAPQKSSDTFDDLVAEKLMNAPMGGSAYTWARMEEMLQLFASRVTHTLRIKFMEGALLLLLFWMAWQWTPGHRTADEQLAAAIIPQSDLQFSDFSSLAADREFSAMIQQSDNDHFPKLTEQGEESTQKGAQTKTGGSNRARLIQSLPLTGLPFVSGSQDNGFSNFVTVAEYSSDRRVSDIQTIDLPAPSISSDPLLPVLPSPSVPESERSICLGIFSSVDYNFIKSPFDRDLLSQPYRRYRVGYGGGLQVAFLKNSWEIATALGYSVKSYAPRHIEEVLGNPDGDSYTDALREIELSVMTLPLHVKYKFVRSGRWSAYLLGGGALHLVMTSGYDRSQPIADNSFLPPSFAPEALNIPDQFPEASVISQKSYDQGLFEGGNLEDNTMLTLNAGLGVEYMANPRIGLFGEPFYQQLLSGNQFGPTRDRISTFSIQLGLRVHIP